MNVHAVQDKVTFNPFDPGFVINPYPAYAKLRETDGFPKALGSVLVARYKDVKVALRDPKLGVGLIPDMIEKIAASSGIDADGQMTRFMRGSIVFSEDPAHSRLRRLVGAAYTPSAVEPMHSIIESRAKMLIEDAVAASPVDMVEAFAVLLPVQVLCDWMNVDDAHHDFIREEIHAVRYLLDPGLLTPRKGMRSKAALATLVDFFAAHSTQSDTHPEPSIIRSLQAARDRGDQLSEEEIAFACIMSFVAGTETSQNLLANMLEALAQRPELHEALYADPSDVAAIIDETMRLETPLQFTKRIAKAETEINGHVIPKGSQVLLCLGAANHDPDVYEDPEAFRLNRRAPPPLAFGFGLHTCLGMRLAKLQAEIALTTLVKHLTPFDIAPGPIPRQTASGILRGPQSLVMSCTRRVAQ